MATLIEHGLLPDGRTVGLSIPSHNGGIGSYNQTCSACGVETQNTPIARVTVEGQSVTDWMHRDCAHLRIMEMQQPVARVWHSGTRREYLDFVQAHEEADLIMNYAYRRPQSARYRWRLV
jgi:hypothetical protein